MKHPYRQIFSISGARQFSAAAFLGRLPAGMMSFAVMLPLSQSTGSYAFAGAVAASVMIGMACCAPFSGRLVDRYGQQYVLSFFIALHLVAAVMLITFTMQGAQLSVLCFAGLLAGASRLSTGTLVRTRWAYVTRELDVTQSQVMLQAAYAFEAVIDELIFISGPMLATALCSAVHPLAGLWCSLGAYTFGGGALAIQRCTQPPIEHSSIERRQSAWSIIGLRIVFMATLLIGISAGAVEVIVIARADAIGLRVWAGLLMGILAFSSMLSGFWFGARQFGVVVDILWIRCLALLMCALLPFAYLSSLMGLIIAMFIAGLLIAPTAIAGQLLAERLLPPRLLNEGMNLIVTAMILGMAIGGGVAGYAIDHWGSRIAGMIPATAVLGALCMARVYMPSLGRVDAY